MLLLYVDLPSLGFFLFFLFFFTLVGYYRKHCCYSPAIVVSVAVVIFDAVHADDVAVDVALSELGGRQVFDVAVCHGTSVTYCYAKDFLFSTCMHHTNANQLIGLAV